MQRRNTFLNTSVIRLSILKAKSIAAILFWAFWMWWRRCGCCEVLWPKLQSRKSCERYAKTFHSHSNIFHRYSSIFHSFSNMFHRYSNIFHWYTNIFHPYSNIFQRYSNIFHSYSNMFHSYSNIFHAYSIVVSEETWSHSVVLWTSLTPRAVRCEVSMQRASKNGTLDILSNF